MWVAFANASTMSNSQVFLLKKCEKLLTFFSAKILAYMPYLMIKVLTICKLTTSLVLNNLAQNWKQQQTYDTKAAKE